MPETMMCVAVAGLPCTGKTLFLDLCTRQGCATLEWSSVVYDDLGRPDTNARTQWFRRVAKTVEEKGPSYYPRMIHAILATTGASMHVVSGARNPVELGELLAMYADRAVVWIEADTTVRFSRRKPGPGRTHPRVLRSSYDKTTRS